MQKIKCVYLTHFGIRAMLLLFTIGSTTLASGAPIKQMALENVNAFLNDVSSKKCDAATKYMRFPFWIDRLYVESEKWTDMCQSISSKSSLLDVTNVYDSSKVDAKMLLYGIYMIDDVDLKKAIYVDAEDQNNRSGWGFIVDCSSGNCLIAGFDDHPLMISKPRRPEIEKFINGETKPITVNMDAINLMFSYPGWGWLSHPAKNLTTAKSIRLISQIKSFFIEAKIDKKHTTNIQITDEDTKRFENNHLSYSKNLIHSRVRTTFLGHPAYKIKYINKRKYTECLFFLLFKNGFRYTISGCAETGKPIESDKEISHILNSLKWM